MKEGLGIFLWKISVACYLIANGILGINKGGDFAIIFGRMFKGNAGTFALIAGVIALVAGIAVLLEMFNIEVSFLDTLILIIAIIWVVYVIIEIVSWITSGFDNFWHVLQLIAVHLMVLASLMIASRKFS